MQTKEDEKESLLQNNMPQHQHPKNVQNSYGSVQSNPLIEAKNVMQRMDNVSKSITTILSNSSSTSSIGKKKRKFSNSKLRVSKKEDNRVLRKIVDNPKDSDLTIDHRHAGTPWTRQLILEELGTASSWLILIVPYVAFFLAFLLNSSTKLWETHYTPLISHGICTEDNVKQIPLINQFPEQACVYQSKTNDGEQMLVLTSGSFTIPVFSSFLQENIVYEMMTKQIASVLEREMIEYSTVVLQRPQEESPMEDDWQIILKTPSRKLQAICDQQNENFDPSIWSCKSPAILDIHFHSMDSHFLTGGSVRIDTVFSLASGNDSPVFNETIANEKVDDDLLLEHLVQSMTINIVHPSERITELLANVRIICIVISSIFLFVWFWCIGGNSFFGEMLPCFVPSKKNEFHNKQDMTWWENPWINFPERRYLLFLLLSLLLVQNPILAFMHFNPSVYGSMKMHIVANILTGIGLHCLLCLWLCLFEGLRYHTADQARKRAEFQKEVLEIRRTSEYLNPKNSSSTYYIDYFEEFGDINGVYGTNLRLKHDPCGEYWADFLIPKLALVAIGTCMVIISSSNKLSPASVNDNESSILEINEVVWYTSLFQIMILCLWTYLIVKEALKTGDLLRKEPFLSTRPAQLAYRFLMSILMLGVASIILPLVFALFSKVADFENSSTKNFYSNNSSLMESSSRVSWKGIKTVLNDAIDQFVLNATELFPFSCSASSMRSGDIIYITACTLVVAFIFLPSTDYILDTDKINESTSPSESYKNENQRRDKRWILPLSRYTHTWRVFPLPIERHEFNSNVKKKKASESYQVNHQFRTLSDDIGRGTIYRENYVPLFCVETALWLAECSWQTYYSSTEYKLDDFAPGIMNLDCCGLELESDIYHEETDTRVYVASNLSAQVYGEEDSVIVVSFRGTASFANVRTDLNYQQVPLPESFIAGIERQAEFTMEISSKLDEESGFEAVLLSNSKDRELQGLKHGADMVLKSLPISRQVYPRIHAGFLTVYLHVRDELIQQVLAVMERQVRKSMRDCADHNELGGNDIPFVIPKIFVCGHSLGGCLGQLLALDIATNVEIKLIPPPAPILCHPKHFRSQSEHNQFRIDGRNRERSNTLPSNVDTSGTERGSVDFVHGILSGIGFVGGEPLSLRPPIAVYTFGQPRVGNHAFARLYKHHVPHTFRVVTEGDPFTVMPLATICPLTFYKHGGLDVILDEGKTGNILVGPTVVETLFRFSKVRTNFQHHLLDTYRDGLESALTIDELHEIYRTHGVNSKNAREGFNQSDLLPDWVTKFTQKRVF